ncbi:LysR family transcriptional regulator [Effusibacillus pohliae]|uniref:LysR family transcriptional regulator n=1 Tax=Effusibacillus pohliae TaxID=232270 RepID=UPI00036DE364|nr:LysR family transcriptional regulator [Effusibacillus pohliae]
MELRQLNTFKVVAEAKGFTRAAELLGYAQSSVTAQIRALEEELGMPLFDRLGKKVVLTDAGRRLLPYAQEMLKLQAAVKELLQAGEVPAGTITVGAVESLAAYRLPSVLQEYKRLYPQVKIILKPGVCWEMRNQVRNGELDLAFTLDAETDAPDLISELLVRERMALIGPPDHHLVGKKRIELIDLAAETLLYTEPGCSYRAQFEQYLLGHGIVQANHLEFWNIEAIKNCVMCGIGIALLPMITVSSELAAQKIALLAWDEAAVQVATQIVYHKAKWLSPALWEFLRIVRKHAETWRS